MNHRHFPGTVHGFFGQPLKGITGNYCELHHIIAQILHISDCFQGQFCKLPLPRVIFNQKLGDYSAINSQ